MELNCKWTDDFDRDEKFFNDFYKEAVINVDLICYYINKNKELFHIKKQNLWVEDGLLKKESLIYYIKKNMFHNNIKFTPLSILKYNINIEPNEINFYLQNESEPHFLTIERSLNSIKWEDTITLFQDLNSLIFIYVEKSPSKNNTKKVYIKNGRRKTKRKFT
jgi:hypothetical protein